MAAPDPTPAAAVWTTAVRVEEDVVLSREVAGRAERASDELPITVSDLLGPRRAYWRRRAAAPVDTERRERMEAGRSWHARLLAALPTEGAFEVRLRRHGIAGRIDLLADVPVEVKTGAAVGADRLIDERPDHVEQIAMYCVLAQRAEGRIVTVSPSDDGSTDVEAADLAFAHPAEVATSVHDRARSLRRAIQLGSAAELPACRWFGRRCEFQQAGVCDCTGDEPPASREILDRAERPRSRPDVADRWRAALRGPPVKPPGTAVRRFRDLIYPRRAYFEATAPPPSTAEPAAVAAPLPDRRSYDRLVEAVEGGPLGEVALLGVSRLAAEEETVGFRGAPYLVRTSRAWSRLRPDEAVRRSPQYALELAFRCLATGTREGRVFLAFDRATSAVDRYQVLRYAFEPMAPFAALWTERSAALAAAVTDRAPGSLPSCPDWMRENCPYRAECGCAAEPGRSQR